MPLLFHAELDTLVQSSSSCASSAKPEDPDKTLYQTFLDSRPDSFETTAIDLIISLAKEFPTVPVHIVHLSSAKALPAIRKAKADGVDLTVETCYHYLWFVLSLSLVSWLLRSFHVLNPSRSHTHPAWRRKRSHRNKPSSNAALRSEGPGTEPSYGRRCWTERSTTSCLITRPA